MLQTGTHSEGANLDSSKTHTVMLNWVLMVTVMAFGLAVTWHTGLMQWVVFQDSTRISMVVLVLLLLGTGMAGWRSVFLARQGSYFAQVRQGRRDFPHGQSICFDYLAHQNPQAHPSESQLLAEVMSERARGTHQVGWFITSLMIKLGLMGTVVGFIMMLSSLEGIETLDLSDIKSLMQQMTQGMGVAMNTTLVGLLGSMLLGMQYLLLDRYADQLVANTVSFAHRDVVGNLPAALAEGRGA